LEFLAEVSFDVARPASVLPIDEDQGLLGAQVVPLLNSLHPHFERPHEADVEHIGQFTGDDVGTPADQNDVARPHQIEDCLDGFLDNDPGGGVQAEQLIQDIIDNAVGVFGEELSHTGRQVMILKDLGHQALVENRPRRAG